MTKKTHIITGFIATLPILYVCPFYSILGILGATLPDIDYKIGIEHRTITHSLLALFSSTLLILVFNKYIALAFFISYSTHLLLDSCTKMGVPFLYPWNKKCFGPKLIKTGGAEELFLFLLLFYLIVLALL